MPALLGPPVKVRIGRALYARRGKLVSEEAGQELHAATFLRKRQMVLDSDLLRNPSEFTRIFAHEVFHFVWLRLGNAVRRSYEALLAAERRRGARGELGWSAEWRKQALRAADRIARTRRWREYVCESFCDSAAWRLLGMRGHEEFTLESRFRRARRAWFDRLLSRPALRI